MKKVWVAALASAAFLLQTASLYAADIKFEGDFRVRGVYANDLDANKDAQDQQAFNDARFRLRTTATAGITTGVVVVDFANVFRDPDNSGCVDTGCRTGNYRLGTVNLGGTYNIIGVREAYLKLDLNMVKLVLGRTLVVLGHSLILHDTADTVAAIFTAGPLDFMLANAKLKEPQSGAVTPPNSGSGSDADLYVLKGGFKHGDMHEVGAFITYLNDRDALLITTGAPDKNTLLTVGVTADGTAGPVNLGFELNYLTGKMEKVGGGPDVDLEGMNVLLKGGAKLASADAGLTVLYTSGDKNKSDKANINGISGNFVLANILVNDNINSDREGQCASFGGSRVGTGSRGCVGGAGITAVKASFGLPGLVTENCYTEAAVIWAQTTKEISTGAKKDLGIEIDLNHKHKIDDNLTVAVNLGYLLSGDAWKSTNINNKADDQMKGVVSLNYMF